MLAKYELNRIEILIFKAFMDSDISLDEVFLINNVLKNMTMNQKFKESIKFNKDFGLFIKQCYYIVWSAEKYGK